MSMCAAGMMTAAPRCNGSGKCVTPSPVACDPYVCKTDGSACFTSCTPGTTAQCKSTTCDGNGSCGPRGLGQMCSLGSDCMSNNCVDSVCCDTPAASCTGCMICNGTMPGKCAPAPANTDPHGACTASAITAANCIGDNCDGHGACGGRPGACSASCSGSKLTQAQCDGTSIACPATSSNDCAGFLICADSASCRQSCGGDGDCVSGYWCNGGNCTVKGDNGAGCNSGNQCKSTNCVDGACCGNASCGGCYACNVGGHEGGCWPVPLHQDPHGACPASSCLDGCDGNGGCHSTCSVSQVCKCGGQCLCSSCSCP
jgi:hypothetical protein